MQDRYQATPGQVEQLFGLEAAGTSLRTEIIAGLTTFLSACYVVIVNPAILTAAGIAFPAGVTATVLVSFICSCAMGLYAQSPILVAPGMGINALFAYTIVVGMHVPLATALGCTVLAGLVFTGLAIFDARSALVAAIPASLRYGVSCGLGLFLSFLGFANAHFIVGDPKTLLAMAPFDAPVLTFIGGLAITMALMTRKIPGALMAGMVITTLAAIPIGRWYGGDASHILVHYTGAFAAPDFSAFGKVDIFGALKIGYMPIIFVLVFTNFIEAMSSFLALAEAGTLKEASGLPRYLKESMHVDAVASVLSGFFGTSPTVAYGESAAGIGQGGRTGLVAVICGLLFLPFLFLSPLLSLVPSVATAPSLVMVGLFMIQCVGKIAWTELEEALPAFIAIMLIPLTYSMTLGISLAFISYVLLKVFNGKTRQVPVAMWVTTGFAVLLVLELKF